MQGNLFMLYLIRLRIFLLKISTTPINIDYSESQKLEELWNFSQKKET